MYYFFCILQAFYNVTYFFMRKKFSISYRTDTSKDATMNSYISKYRMSQPVNLLYYKGFILFLFFRNHWYAFRKQQELLGM